MKYPAWFPFPSCWLKAFFLLILTGILLQPVVGLLRNLGEMLTLTTARPEPLILSFALISLSPILLVAITHYLLHRLVNRYAPKLQSPQIRKDPILMSLWEGLYGWMSIVLGLLVVISLLATSPNIAEDLTTNSADTSGFLGLVWLSIVAYLYQVQALVFRLAQRP